MRAMGAGQGLRAGPRCVRLISFALVVILAQQQTVAEAAQQTADHLPVWLAFIGAIVVAHRGWHCAMAAAGTAAPRPRDG
jgi:TRAP-type C4-dicarboxylate transport system permease small subunit